MDMKKLLSIVSEADDPVDTVTVDVPLMIRLLEYAREEAKTDMDLHNVADKLIELSKSGTLTMDNYDDLVPKADPEEMSESYDTYCGNEASQADASEDVHFTKTKRKGNASVTVSATAENMQELYDILKLAGITLPADKPDNLPVVAQEPPPQDMAMPTIASAPEPDVLTGLLKNKLQNYLRNGRQG